MNKAGFLLLVGLAFTLRPVRACDCAMDLPDSFCATLDTAWNEPDVVVLAVKLDQIAYGMRIKVLQTFLGNVLVDDTLMVWGDNGACCRWPVWYWADGDTAVWAINATDSCGNWTAPLEPDLEMPGDYCINLCGVYWLDYSAGMVFNESTGIFNGEWIVPGVDSLAIADFWPAVTACLATSIEPHGMFEGLSVRALTDGISLSLPTTGIVDLSLIDVSGRAVLRRRWNGETLWIGELGTGAYLLELEGNGRRIVRRLYVP